MGDAKRDYLLFKDYWAGQNGYSKDNAKAIELLKMSAEAGYPPAMFQLGKFYQVGEGVPRDEQYGRSLIVRAARAGDRGAKMELYKLGIADTK